MQQAQFKLAKSLRVLRETQEPVPQPLPRGLDPITQ